MFDPDGRLIASDYSSTDEQYTQELPFSFTADRPGIYSFAVGFNQDSTFTGMGIQVGIKVPYNLTISGLGNLGLGEVVAGATVLDLGGAPDGAGSGPSSIAGFGVENGDLGAIIAGTSVISDTDGTIGVDDNLRAVVGSTIRIGRSSRHNDHAGYPPRWIPPSTCPMAVSG